MKILVGCEYSGRVRDAFTRRGHFALSVDLLPTDLPGPHVIADIRDVLKLGWDMFLAFPPCTALCNSGNSTYANTDEREDALDFVIELMSAPIRRIAIENPIGAISSRIEKPTQIIQPWQFGHGETKATCLWLTNLPKLKPTNVVAGREKRIWKLPPSPTRAKERSLTYLGIAEAMAQQWGDT